MLKRKGFTLIEVIVVLSIMAILASFVICSYSYHTKKAYTLKAVSGGTQIYNAFMWYYRENKNNLIDTMGISFIEKATNYDISSIRISKREKIAVNIKYKYEEDSYNMEIYPELQKYFIRDEGNVPIYP